VPALEATDHPLCEVDTWAHVGRGAGGDNYYTVSRVPVEGGEIEDVFAKPDLDFFERIRVHDGYVFMVMDEPSPRLGDAILSFPLP